MSLYRNILKQAWNISWRNKYLWFFGIFAALLGNGGEYEILFRGSGGGQDLFPAWRQICETGIFSRGTLHNISEIMAEDALSLFLALFILLAVLVMFAFLVWLTIVSQVAIVNNSASIIGNKKVGFQDGLNSGIKNFWPIFSLNVVLKLIIYLVFFLIGLPLVLSAGKAGLLLTNFFYIIAFIIFILVAICLSFIIKYAIAYVVIRGNSFVVSIKHGWQLFIKNWLISVEMALILFFINILAGLAIILIVLTLTVPFLFLGFIFYYLASFIGFWFIALLAAISLFLVIVLGGAILANFQISSWTGLFLELEKNRGASKIIRVVSGAINK